MRGLEIAQFLCVADNFGVLCHDPATGATASIDAPHAPSILSALQSKGWTLTHVFTTHHHHDHVGGNAALKQATGCEIVGPSAEGNKIPGLDAPVAEGDAVRFGGFDVRVISTPGHTAGHVTYWLPQAEVAFTGDTLFAMGCGRILEGSAETMWASLSKIAALPDETTIYCGHEYTVDNARFALTVEPDNGGLQARHKSCVALREQGALTLPTTLALERQTNPFLRAGEPAIRERLGMKDAPAREVFRELRERKNGFR